MARVPAHIPIEGVTTIALSYYPDRRGSFRELFRREWLPDLFDDQFQINCSISHRGVLRGLHYHLRQTDLWIPVSGSLRTGLVDTRRDSATYGASVTLDMSAETPYGLLIPPGVAHGYLALTELTLAYVVDRYYDASDEHGIAWNDPGPALDWGVDDPILSSRDRENTSFDW